MGVTSGTKDVIATKTSSGNTGDTLRFTWSQKERSTSGNYTIIDWKLQLIAGSAGKISSSASKKWSVTVNGTPYSGTNTIGISNNATKTLANGSTKIPHDSDGKKTFSVSFSQQFDITFNSYVGTISGNASWTLNDIPRYANFSGTPALSDITQTSVKISWSANATCSKVEYLLNGSSKNTNSSLNASSGSYTYTGLSPNTSYTFAVKITRKDSGLVTNSSNATTTTLPIATITSSVSFNVGEDLILEFANSDKNESTVKLSVENDSGSWVDISTHTAPLGVSSFTLVLSDSSSVSKLTGYCQKRTEMGVKVACGVTIDGTYYGNTYTGKAYITGSNPTFSGFSLINTDTTCTDILGNNTSTIQGMGNMQVKISTSDKAVAKNGATIIKYIAYLTVQDGTAIIKSSSALYSDTETVNIDLGTYSSSGNYTIHVYAIDSRDNTSSTVSKNFSIYPYHIPVPTINLHRLNDFEKEILLDLSITYSRVLVNNSAKNSIKSIEYRYAEGYSNFPASWTSLTGFSNSNNGDDGTVTYSKNTSDNIWMEISISNTCKYEFKITDSVQSIIVSGISIEPGVPLLGEFDDGHISIGMLPDLSDDALLQVNSDIIATDTDGKRIKLLSKLNDVTDIVTNRKIGTRNYVRNSSEDWSDWWQPNSTISDDKVMGIAYLPFHPKIGDEYTISFDIEWIQFNVDYLYVDWKVKGGSSGRTAVDLKKVVTSSSGKKHISAIKKIIDDDEASVTEIYLNFCAQNSDGNGKLRIKNLQVERGNLESDWKPAIEDVKITSVNNMNIACGSKIVVTKAATSVAVFSFADLNSIFSASDCDKTNTMCIFANGDGSLQSVHIDGATVSGTSWYATFGSTAKSGDMRINYTVIYFGESATSVLADGDEVSY